ncbi:MAG: hypothetical protein ACRD0P_36735 [Stackebrandtia sp.]
MSTPTPYFVAVTRGMEVLATAGAGRAESTANATTSLAALPLTDRIESA